MVDGVVDRVDSGDGDFDVDRRGFWEGGGEGIGLS